MKKILFAVTTDLNYDQRMQRICGSLARNGYDITLVGRKWKNSDKLQDQLFKQYRFSCWFNKGKLFYLEYNIRLYLYLLFKNFDAYCAIDLDTILPVFFKARQARKPFIYDAHEYFPEVIEVANRRLVKNVWLWVEKFVVSRTKYAYTVTQSIAGLFYEKYGTSFEVIRNISVFQPFTPEPKPVKYILYQGAVNAGRGIEPLLEAMQYVDVQLVICGRGDLYEEMVRKAAELGVADKVQFRGYVLPAELLEITRKAWLGIMLLENIGLSYYYSLANKFFDYIHAGIPQLTVNFPEYKHINDQFEVAAMVDLTPESIAGVINKLYNDLVYYNMLAANCERARQVYNWQQEEQKLLAFYRKIWQDQEA